MRQKLFLTLLALLTLSGSGAWADSTWNITSSDLTTDSWTAMGDATPAGVTSLGSYTAYYKTENITLTSAASLEVRFKYSSGSHRLEILGVDVLDGSSNVVASDYHFGFTGTAMDKNTYLLNALSAGTYTLRYIINANLSSSAGNITINTIKYADNFASISQWYVVRIHANQAHYMYYDSNATTGIRFTSSTADISTDNYLWGFVKNGSGVSIYNKAAGSSLAIDNATPSTMSADGTSVAFTLSTVEAGAYGWAADAFFSVYQTAGTYLNYQNSTLARWKDADAGSNFMIYEVEAPTTLSYTLTDVNGAVYTGSYTGMAGITDPPSLTGCDGYTLTGGSWSGTTYSATINFPFDVSSNGVTNYTYINSFENKSGYTVSDGDCYYWHANGSNVIVHSCDVPDNTKSEGVYTENEKYKWAIYPTFTSAENKFTFTIKNSSTGTYINNTTTGSNHENSVTLSSTATPLQYATSSTNNCGTIYKWYIPSTSNYLSVNSVNGGTNQVLGVHNADHDGLSIGFYTPADFATLETNLGTACNAYTTFKNTHTIGTGLGQYNGSSYSDMETALSKAQNESSVYTAAQLTTDIETLSNPATKLTINLPTSGFYRIKGYSGNYITSNTVDSNASMAGTASANNIIYYSSDKNLIFFGSGYGIYNTHTVAPASSTLNSFTFSQGAQIGKYYVVSNASGVGTYCYDNTSKGTKLDRNGSPVTDGSYQTDWTVEEVTSLPVTITSAAKYATLYSPVALTIPTGVTAYTATDNDTYLTLTAIAGSTIPANTGVILYADVAENTTYNFDITTGGSVEGNALTGTVAAISRPEGSYILATGTSGVGFYGDGASTIPGFKAYLSAAAGGAKGFVGFDFDDDATSIDHSTPATRHSDDAIYDLGGRKINVDFVELKLQSSMVNGGLQKGIYIVHGKKILK